MMMMMMLLMLMTDLEVGADDVTASHVSQQ
jgi:hypothetical protein